MSGGGHDATDLKGEFRERERGTAIDVKRHCGVCRYRTVLAAWYMIASVSI